MGKLQIDGTDGNKMIKMVQMVQWFHIHRFDISMVSSTVASRRTVGVVRRRMIGP